MKSQLRAIHKFITEDIWRVTSENTSKGQFILIRIARILILAVKGFFKDKCLQKASALTYYSLLSIVPVAAMAFGIAKGFGFKQVLEKELQSRFAGQEDIILWVTEFADKYLLSIKGGMITGVGFLVLMWSVMNVLGSIEEYFNEIWDIKRARSFVRKFSDYISILIVAVLFIVSSGSMLVLINNQVQGVVLFSFASPFLVKLFPYMLIWVVFTMVLYIMPNTKVKFSAALLGGIIAGTLFQLLQYYYIHFQIGVSRYNAVYGSFAAFPLFLFWLQTSWLIVLFGAEVGFATQNVKSYEFEYDTRNISFSYKRLVALLITHKVVKLFVQGQKGMDNQELSLELKLPIKLVQDVVYELINAEVLAEVNALDGKKVFYLPAKDINSLKVSTILSLLEQRGTSDFHGQESTTLAQFRNILGHFQAKITSSKTDVLLRDI
ncbi:MAG: YihY/virulence factor BrkB family protein [Marinilabiliaceae bacterium]|nr:YihY/virulence factor BrkB family protein [Marinilabiliaceae bacterium]